MKTLAIIQARMGSTRLPGKVMMPLRGYPMIRWVIERVSTTKKVDKVVVATSTNLENNILAEYVESLGYDVFRGDENNVLDRYYQCARQYNPENIIRITGDCPLINSWVIASVIEEHELHNADYTSNIFPKRTYPKGLDTEIMTYKVLCRIWKQAITDCEKEHVTTYIHHHFDTFKICNVLLLREDESHHQLSVDTQEDFDRITELLKRRK